MRLMQQQVPALRLVSGSGTLGRLGAECDRFGIARVALICSGSLLRAGDGPVQAALGGRLAGIFADVRPHSPVPAVEAAAEALRRMQADAIVAVGGGSVIVTARAAAILLAEGRPVPDLCTRIEADGRLVSPRLAAPKLPQIVVPTTPTTATVKAGAAVQDPADGARLALFDPAARARAVLLDPDLMAPVPPAVVLSATLNALAMGIEGLLSPLPTSAMADAALMHGIRLIAVHLRAALAPGNLSDRLQLASAAVLVGQGTDHAGGGVVSALGHAIGPRHHVDNGVVNALLVPAALRFNGAHAAEGIAKVAIALGLPPDPDPEPLIAAFSTLVQGLVPPGLTGLGMTEADLEPVAMAAMRDWFLRGNSRPITGPDDLMDLMRQAL